jgi:hypothetical protein
MSNEIEDPCCGCGAESEVGCGINPHRYYCEPCWTLYKRGKLVTEAVREEIRELQAEIEANVKAHAKPNIRSGQAIQPVNVEIEEDD